MPTYGITATGFLPKVLTDIQNDLRTAWRAAFGATALTTPQSVGGQVIDIMSERFAELWEALQTVYSSEDPDNAEEASLEKVCSLTGTVRLLAAYSTVTLTLCGTPATVIPAGSVVSTGLNGTQFKTLADATIVAVPVWTATTVYAIGQRVYQPVGPFKLIYQCDQAGTSAGSGGPSSTAQNIVDNTTRWDYIGASDGAPGGAIDVAAKAVLTGARTAPALELDTIDTPVSGWRTVTNILDAVLGRDQETDAALRLRRANELSKSSGGPVEAIKAALLKVSGVTAVFVFENTTDAVDGDGLPPHSVEALVLGGTDAAVAAAIFASKAAGILASGTTSVVVTDSMGLNHTINFTRPTTIPIHVRVDVVKLPADFPADGSTQIKNAIVADPYPIGKNVTAARVEKNVWTVAGVLDVLLTYIGTASPAISAVSINITPRQLATFSVANVTVNLSDGTL